MQSIKIILTTWKILGQMNVAMASMTSSSNMPVKVLLMWVLKPPDIILSMTTISQGAQTRFPVQLAFAKFLSKIKGNFWGSVVSLILALY